MRQLVLLQFGEMLADQFRRESIAFAEHFELHQQTFLHIARATTDRIETHDGLARFFDHFFGNFFHRGHLFVGRVETAVGVEIADDADRGIVQSPDQPNSCSVAIRDVRRAKADALETVRR